METKETTIEKRRRSGAKELFQEKLVARDARIKDLRALLQIYNDAVKNSAATFDITPFKLGERTKWFEEHHGRFALIVGEAQGSIVGYASPSKFRDKPAYLNSVESSIYIGAPFRNLGIGTILMKEIISRARKLKYHTIVAGIVPPNEASICLHLKLGFEPVGTFKQMGLKFVN